VNTSKFYRWVIGGGCTLLALIAVVVAAIVYHLNAENGTTGWLGLGTLILLGAILFFFGLMALIAWLCVRGFLPKDEPKPQTAAAAKAAASKESTAKPQKTSIVGYIISTILFLVVAICLILAALPFVMTMVHHTTWDTISTIWKGPLPVLQPQGRCDDAFVLDDAHHYDFSASTEDRVRIEPGSDTKLCYGSLVSIPGKRWITWGAQFVKPAGQKEACVAYFGYIYPNGAVQIIGPKYGPELDMSNMSGLWRIATNCPIEYYRW